MPEQDAKKILPPSYYYYNNIDPRGAFAFRIVFAFVSLYEAIDMIGLFPELLVDGNEGYFPRYENILIYSHRRDISILNAAGSPFACGLMTGTFLISIFTLALGYYTRLSMFVVTLFLLSMNTRFGAMGFGGLGFAGIVSVYGNLIPDLDAYSLDRWNNKDSASPKGSWLTNVAVTTCITIHLSIMYYVCGASKYGLKSWDEGDKIFLIAHASGVMREGSKLLTKLPLLCRVLTHSTVYLEMYAFLIFLMPFPLIRCVGILVLVSLHVGISLFVHVVGFNFSMIALLVLLMPPIAYDVLESSSQSFLQSCIWMIRKIKMNTATTIQMDTIKKQCQLVVRYFVSAIVIVHVGLLCFDSGFTLCQGLATVSGGKRHCPGLSIDLREMPNPLWQQDTLLREWLHVLHGGFQRHYPFAYGGTEIETFHYLLAWTDQDELVTLYENNTILSRATMRIWDPNQRESNRMLTKFKNFFSNAQRGHSNVISMFKHLCNREVGIQAVGHIEIKTPVNLNPDRKSVIRREDLSSCVINLFFRCEDFSIHDDFRKLIQLQTFDDKYYQMLRRVIVKSSSSRDTMKILPSRHIKHFLPNLNAVLVLKNRANQTIKIFWQHDEDETKYVPKGTLKPGATWSNICAVGHKFYIHDEHTQSLLDVVTVDNPGKSEFHYYYYDDDDDEDDDDDDDK